ncbi:hypothetical protein P3X46_027579 [Hevea brasiliensis]|uniref:Leucine-rich repeat-containing N-terminal plant-type domain-containing protein n=1 Tax=Hevea brasiliensis TaxID=3981 RepID=A0ABQ9L1Y8_HEVBR|nr:hypothetical protein P3X46_027579 [Hevea brasiliensis]
MGASVTAVEMLLVLTLIENLFFSCIGANSSGSCIMNEREALLKFKHDLVDPSNRLMSWIGEDCCTWKGVSCNNLTGHVIKLDLHISVPSSFTEGSWKFEQSRLGGEINHSLLNLRHLNYVDLSGNDFSSVEFPSFLFSLQKLKYLDLSSAQFSGKVPHHFGNLSYLQYLDLSWNYFTADNLHFLSSLSSLKYLDLSNVDLSGAANWLHSINMLPALVELRLSICHLSNIPSLPHINFTSLDVFDIQGNNLNSTIPLWLFNISNFKYLDLSENVFQGSISSQMGNYNYLSFLDLSENELEGEIPGTLRNLCSLIELNLADNKFRGDISGSFGSSSGCIQSNLKTLILESNNFSGSLPGNLGQFKHLEYLDLSSNSFQGPIPTFIGQLSNLKYLDIHNNSLDGVVSELHFSELTSLTYLIMDGNSLVFDVGSTWVPPFQLQTIELSSCKKNISDLKMSNAGISESIPAWFENISFSIQRIYLDYNNFDGPLIDFPSDVSVLDLSKNLLQGHIHKTVGDIMPEMRFFSLSNNHLNGSIPKSLCQINLYVIDLAHNNLSGYIPKSMGSLGRLVSLHLENNNLQGSIPTSLKRLHVWTLDLSGNALTGPIPSWIGENISSLRIIDVHSNMFGGEIPPELCVLEHSSLFWQFTAMAFSELEFDDIWELYPSYDVMDYDEHAAAYVKGRQLEYTKTIRFLFSIDLSGNNFVGEIPQELTLLTRLRNLNLSRNYLKGHIPSKLAT